MPHHLINAGELSSMATVPLEHDAEISVGVTTRASIGEYMRHHLGQVVISRITEASPDLDKQDATWTVRPGLAGGSGISLESANFPGSFLRHQHGAVYQHGNDGSRQF